MIATRHSVSASVALAASPNLGFCLCYLRGHCRLEIGHRVTMVSYDRPTHPVVLSAFLLCCGFRRFLLWLVYVRPPEPTNGFIRVYSLVWLGVIDLVKVALFRRHDMRETRQTNWQEWLHMPLDVWAAGLANSPKPHKRLTCFSAVWPRIRTRRVEGHRRFRCCRAFCPSTGLAFCRTSWPESRWLRSAYPR